ncbi:MAG: YihY/virulence factor BrkB family protein [Bacilli bacterium]
MEFTKRYFKKLIRIIKKPEMKVLPGNIAFFLVLSIFPIITLCGFFATFFNVSIDSVINLMNDVLPNEVNNILVPYITGNGMDLHIGFSIILGYIVASNGAHSIIVSCNTLYGLEHSSYLKRRIKALFITILLLALFVFSLIVLAFGNNILKFILSMNIFDNIGDKIYYLFLLLKWPIAIIVIYIMIKLIFILAPDSVIKSKITTRGAFFTSIAWLISTFIYSYYVQHFSHYDIFYGSLSNIIVMMMWIYILSCSLVIGIAINVQNYRNYENKNKDIADNK